MYSQTELYNPTCWSDVPHRSTSGWRLQRRSCKAARSICFLQGASFLIALSTHPSRLLTAAVFRACTSDRLVAAVFIAVDVAVTVPVDMRLPLPVRPPREAAVVRRRVERCADATIL